MGRRGGREGEKERVRVGSGRNESQRGCQLLY